VAVTILALGGSLCAQSPGLAAVPAALEGARHARVTTELYDIRELDREMYQPLAAAASGAAQGLQPVRWAQ